MRYSLIIFAALLFTVAVAEEQDTAAVKTEKSAKAAVKSKDAVVITKSVEKEKEAFVLSDMGWRDPFVDPRDATRPPPGEKDATGKGIVGPTKTTLQKALDALSVKSIIGLDVGDNLSAVIGGVTVRVGDTVTGESLEFNVDRITKDSVYLRCLTEDKKLESLHDLIIEKKLGD
jgi:hypothetical protein